MAVARLQPSDEPYMGRLSIPHGSPLLGRYPNILTITIQSFIRALGCKGFTILCLDIRMKDCEASLTNTTTIRGINPRGALMD